MAIDGKNAQQIGEIFGRELSEGTKAKDNLGLTDEQKQKLNPTITDTSGIVLDGTKRTEGFNANNQANLLSQNISKQEIQDKLDDSKNKIKVNWDKYTKNGKYILFVKNMVDKFCNMI